jgi:hypothetical protein
MPEIKRFSIPELDRLTSRLYNEFFANNERLFERDRMGYFYMARLYVLREIEREKYFGK